MNICISTLKKVALFEHILSNLGDIAELELPKVIAGRCVVDLTILRKVVLTSTI